jgi:hypothetical protein
VRLAAVAAAALVLAGVAAAAPPRYGVVVPGRSLGGVRLGATPAQVRARWGADFGICRGCPDPTWYYNFARFAPEGVGVTFRKGRAVRLFTLWSPSGWRTSEGLSLGATASQVTTLYAGVTRRDCAGYYLLLLQTRAGVTEFLILDERLWGLAVSRASEPCR